MNERGMYSVAAGIGTILIGGLVFLNASKASRSPSIRLLGQTNALSEGPTPGDPPGVYLLVESKRSEDSLKPVEVDIVDAHGLVYPSEVESAAPLDPDSEMERKYYRVPLGYADQVVKPRLKASQGGRTILDVPLADFPSPMRVDLKPTTAPPVLLTLKPSRPLSTTSFGLLGNVRVEATGPIPLSEELHVKVLCTNHDSSRVRIDSRSGNAEVGTYLTLEHPKGYLFLPYLKPGDVVRLRIESRLSLKTRSQTVHILGVRLAQLNGETEFVLPESPYVVHALGAVFTLTSETPHQPSSQDHRKPRLSLQASVEGKELSLTGQSPAVSVDVLAPRPENLAVGEMWVGPRHLDYNSRLKMPPSSKPFDLVLAFGRKFGGTTISSAECNVPVNAQR